MLNEAEQERLAILVEECAEVQQIACKILRHGYDSYHPDDKLKTANRRLLENEVDELLAVIMLMQRRLDFTTALHGPVSRLDATLERKMWYTHHQG